MTDIGKKRTANRANAPKSTGRESLAAEKNSSRNSAPANLAVIHRKMQNEAKNSNIVNIRHQREAKSDTPARAA